MKYYVVYTQQEVRQPFSFEVGVVFFIAKSTYLWQSADFDFVERKASCLGLCDEKGVIVH